MIGSLWVLCCGLLLHGSLLAAQQPLKPKTADRLEQGREIYNFRCYFCHGYSGDARTLTATFVTPSPRDFTATPRDKLSRQQMIDAVTEGKPQTAMTAFSRVLNAQQIEAVVDFIRLEFMQNRALNTQYHTLENGWPEHARYAIAFPFATGEIALDKPWEELSEEQASGKRLFLASCITCHDRSRVVDEGLVWQKQSISYPRNNYSHTRIDAVSAASIYAQHDISPETAELSESAASGKVLWLQNCAFCHAADGSGQNWIGSFLEPSPRDLRDRVFMSTMSRDLLRQRIRNGLVNTSMPAWGQVLNHEQIDHVIDYISDAFYPLKD
ncbi:MAG: c-type cytochrome [Gammaproteobacteria bacterium]|nr:c-type cytochrome [Gammaproteobacteria bacterium]